MSFDHGAPTETIPPPPTAASNGKMLRQCPLSEGLPLSQPDVGLPYRRSHASLYASTFSPPGSRSQSPAGRPGSRATMAGSVFGSGPNNALDLMQGAEHRPGDPLNLLLKAFVPHIAVHASRDTDDLLKEKGFDLGLWELLRPFGERVQGKVTIRDSVGSSRTYDDYSVHFVRFGEGIEHPEPTSRGLTNTIQAFKANMASERTEEVAARSTRQGENLQDVEAVVNRHLSYAEESYFSTAQNGTDISQGLGLDAPSPYYALYLRRLLSGLPVVPHETFAHPVACVMAISSRCPAPIETLRRLYQESSAGEKRLPEWVDSEYLRYYVLVHDEEKDDITTSMSLFDQMKRNLGLHCHLLRIRGTQSATTDDDSIPLPRSEWMPAAEELAEIRRSEGQEDFEYPTRYIFGSDATAIRTFIREMVTQSIIPTMERHVSVWNDQVASRRRGVTGKLLGMTRRWGFGSASKSSVSPSSGSNYDALGFYRADAPEAIMRKLADYAFMLRDWKLAHSTYDLLRSDFINDKAWRYHAATNEMSALSLLIVPQNLSTKIRAETIDTMLEAAFYSYVTRCSAPYGALRCIALSVELLRLRGGSAVDDAAKWGIRLVESRIAGPVGDALIRERVSVCYASKTGIGSKAWGARRRKSAFWSIMGAEEWCKQEKWLQAQLCLHEARRMYSQLANEHAIDQYAHASSLIRGIGTRLNRQLAMNHEENGMIKPEDTDGVDEESQILGGSHTAIEDRGRRLSAVGAA